MVEVCLEQMKKLLAILFKIMGSAHVVSELPKHRVEVNSVRVWGFESSPL